MGFQADGTICHFKTDGTGIHPGVAPGGSLTDLALDDRCELYVADTKAQGGLWILDARTDGVVGTELALGTAPAFASGILFLP